MTPHPPKFLWETTILVVPAAQKELNVVWAVQNIQAMGQR